MNTHKKCTFTLKESTLIDIDIMKLMELVGGTDVSKFSIINDCLLKSFGLFESELVEYGKSHFKGSPKKYFNTKPITVTLPFEIVDSLDFYSKKLGIKKSHLVMIGIVLNRELN